MAPEVAPEKVVGLDLRAVEQPRAGEDVIVAAAQALSSHDGAWLLRVVSDHDPSALVWRLGRAHGELLHADEPSHLHDGTWVTMIAIRKPESG